MDKGQGSRNQKAKIEEFKGYITSIDSPSLGLDVAEDAINIAYDLDGGIRKREGIKQDISFDNKEREKLFFVKSRSTKTKLEQVEKKYVRQENVNILKDNNFIKGDVNNLNLIGDTNNKITKIVSSDKVIYYSKTREIQPLDKEDLFIYKDGSNDIFLGSYNPTNLIIDKDNNLYFADGKIIYKHTFNSNTNVETFDLTKWLIDSDRIVYINIDKNNNIYYATQTGNIFDFKNAENTSPVLILNPSKLNISSFVKTKDHFFVNGYKNIQQEIYKLPTVVHNYQTIRFSIIGLDNNFYDVRNFAGENNSTEIYKNNIKIIDNVGVIISIAIDKNGIVYSLDQNGTVYKNGVSIKDNLRYARYICVDKDGNWYCNGSTYGNIIYKNGSPFITLNVNKSIEKIIVDNDFNVYYMTNESIYKNNTLIKQFYNFGSSTIVHPQLSDFYINKNGNIYVSTKEPNYKGTIFKDGISIFKLDQYIQKIIVDDDDNIYILDWRSTEGGRIYKNGKEIFYEEYHPVISISINNDNELIFSHGTSVFKIKNEKMIYIDYSIFYEDAKHLDYGNSLKELYLDKNDNVYWGTDNGNIIKGGSKIHSFINGPIANKKLKIYKIKFDKDNNIYVAVEKNDTEPVNKKYNIYKSYYEMNPIKPGVYEHFVTQNGTSVIKEDDYQINDFSLDENVGSLSLYNINLNTNNHILSSINFKGTLPTANDEFHFIKEDGTESFVLNGNDTNKIVVTSSDKEIDSDSINEKFKGIKYISSTFFNRNSNEFNKDKIVLDEYTWTGDVFPEVKLKSQKGEVSYKYEDYILEISNLSNDRSNVSLYKIVNGNKVLMPIVSKDGVISSGVYTIEKSDNNDYSIATVGDSTILANGKNIYSFIPIQNTKSDGSIKEYIVAGELNEFAEDVPYTEVIHTGLNRLLPEPLKLVQKEEKLNELPFNIKDIVITKPNDDDLVLFVQPNNDYIAHSQVTFETQAERDVATFAWSLSYMDQKEFKWVEHDFTKDNPVIVTNEKNLSLNASLLKETGEYQLTLKVTKTNPNNSKDVVTLQKTISFTTRNESIDDEILTNTSLWTEGELKTCKYVANFDDKLVMYGNGTQQIYTSELGRPYFITATEIVKADAFGKGEDVVLIQNFKDTKIIFTKSTMMSMTGAGNTEADDPWKVLPLDGSTGCVGHNAATPIENTLAFVAKDGVYIIQQLSVADQRVDLAKISSPVDKEALPYFDVVDKVDEELMSDIFATNLEQRLIISYPQKEYMLVYDYGATGLEKAKWAKWVSIIVPKDFIVKENVLYILDKNFKDVVFIKQPKITNEIHEQEYPIDFFRDGQVDYEFKYVSKWSDLGFPYEAKKIKRIFTTTDNKYDGTVSYQVEMLADGYPNIKYYVDNSSYDRPKLKTGVQFNSLTTFRESNNIHSHIELISKPGRSVRLIITNNKDEPFKLDGVQVEFSTSKAKGKQISK